MTAVTVTPTVRVGRIEGSLFTDAPASVNAWFVTDGIDADGKVVFPGQSFDANAHRTIDEVEAAKTVAVDGKTYTVGEILKAALAMAMGWKAEDDVARAAAAAAGSNQPPA